jgi:hypothetical protein
VVEEVVERSGYGGGEGCYVREERREKNEKSL